VHTGSTWLLIGGAGSCFALLMSYRDGIDALDSCVRIHLQKNQRCPAEATRQIEQHWRPGSSKIV